MQPAEQENVDVVLRYFNGCNTGELADLLPTLTENAVHYFLPEGFPTIRGFEHGRTCHGTGTRSRAGSADCIVEAALIRFRAFEPGCVQ